MRFFKSCRMVKRTRSREMLFRLLFNSYLSGLSPRRIPEEQSSGTAPHRARSAVHQWNHEEPEKFAQQISSGYLRVAKRGSEVR